MNRKFVANRSIRICYNNIGIRTGIAQQYCNMPLYLVLNSSSFKISIST